LVSDAQIEERTCGDINEIPPFMSVRLPSVGFNAGPEHFKEPGVEASAAMRIFCKVALPTGNNGVFYWHFFKIILVEGSLRERWRGKREFLIESSGGLTEENVKGYICNDIDIISTSSVHQGVPHVDFSLKIEHGTEVPAT